MPEDAPNTETGKPAPREEQVAKRWLGIRGISPPPKTKPGGFLDRIKEIAGGKEKAAQTPEQQVSEAYDLLAERDDLRGAIVREQRRLMEPIPEEAPAKERRKAFEEAGRRLQQKTQESLTFEQKRQLIRSGRVSKLAPGSSEDPPVEVVRQSQSRIKKIEERLDQIFSVPGMYEKFQADLNKQIRIRNQALEVQSINGFTESTELVSVKLTREAQVGGRALTSVEQRVIDENRTLAEEARTRKAELMRDPDVFDRVRILEIRKYRDQLLEDRFAETPSRKRYLEKIERYWAEGKKVLLTGETGTGKTEIIKHASNKLFGVNPESVTGHQDLSIYELLGKTGFQVQVGDVFRPAPMIRAMTGRNGKGQPFLFDEIDRAPNQSVMGIKTILNARPGERGVKVQTDTAGSFDVGPDYAVSATANIKSKKYITATELDPAIVRVFDAPMDIDYMPAYEVYDLALASLMDKRGGVPLTENDARVLLKNLCDASSWIQDAYQGRKIITDPASGTFLEARGQAATGEAATLKKALLDPGRTLDMLRGWTAAQTRGITFEDYINERILEFINNRAYPEEDRYYLTEIFALKGFLKGHKASKLMVVDLTQDTLDRWSGAASKKGAVKGTVAYLSADRVARLDPYRRFKRPVSAEAEELLEEEVPEAEGQEAVVGPSNIKTLLTVLRSNLDFQNYDRVGHETYIKGLTDLVRTKARTTEDFFDAYNAYKEIKDVSNKTYSSRGLEGLDILFNQIMQGFPLRTVEDLTGFRGTVPIDNYNRWLHTAYMTKIVEVAISSNNPRVVDKVIELANEFRAIERRLYRSAEPPISGSDWVEILKNLQTKRLSL